MHQLTLKQLGEVESGSNFYKSVGKMYVPNHVFLCYVVLTQQM